MSITEAPIPPAEDQAVRPVNDIADTKPTVVETSKSADREYVVMRKIDESLQRTPSGDIPLETKVWMFVATIDASSADQAVRRAAEKPGTSFLNADGPTTLVAIPSRSWNPISVSVKTETTIVLG